eukprot:scpid97220/ scgid33686/ 
MEAYYEHCHYHGYAVTPPEFSILRTLRIAGLNIYNITFSPWQRGVVAYTLGRHGNTASSFEINRCHVGDSGMALFSPILREFRKLRWLRLAHCGLTDARLLVPVLTELPELHSLSLYDNPLGDDGFAVLGAVMETCTALSSVDLSRVGLTNVSLPLLAHLIHGWPALAGLTLTHNWFGGADRDVELAFVEAIRASPAIQHLSMNYKITAKEPQTFAEELKVFQDDVMFPMKRLMLTTF